MTTAERNQCIYEVRTKLRWPYSRIAATYGVSRQRVAQVVRYMEKLLASAPEPIPLQFPRLNGEPISATQAAKITGVPDYAIHHWISRGQVKVVSRRPRPGPGATTLLDPVSLQERIDRYRPRKRPARN